MINIVINKNLFVAKKHLTCLNNREPSGVFYFRMGRFQVKDMASMFNLLNSIVGTVLGGAYDTQHKILKIQEFTITARVHIQKVGI